MSTRLPSPSSLRRRAHYRRRTGEQAGVALVITLAALVLLSAIILAFFSLTQVHRQISFSSSGQNRAEILSRTAIDTTMADLLSEIQAGSLGGGYTSNPANPVTIYLPATNFTIVPYRTIDASLHLANLVKESIGGTPFWTNTAPGYSTTIAAPVRANSDPSYLTTAPSLNGRYIPGNIWSKPDLLTGANPTPSWVLITRQGAITNATTLPAISTLASSAPGNSSYVIGRYAYAIYDEGGLVDVNVAGNALSAAANAQRGRLNQAALGQLPLADNTPGSTANTNAAYAMVTWRSTTASTNSATWVFNPTNTFLTVSAPKDQAFVSRQDLINYITANGLQTNALPYIGTFSRELNQPGYTPDPNRATVLATNGVYYVPPTTTTTWTGPPGLTVPLPNWGLGNPYSRGNDNNFNPSLANYRGTDGNPLIKQRFPLSRLSWLTFRGPIADASGNLNPTGDSGVAAEITAYENAGIPANYLQQGTPANVLTYFGLVWDTTNNPNTVPAGGSPNNQWIYTSPEGSLTNPKPTTHIKTLAPIVGLNQPGITRSTGPDFFETLQAAILAGSLGRDSGPPGINNEGSSTHRSWNASGVASYVILDDQNVYRHVLQLGANIIDQYDPDSYPTAIIMGAGLPGATDPATLFTTVFGTENLPYVTRMNSWGVQNVTTQTNTCYISVEVWNPHQPSISSIPAALAPPTTLRYRAVGDPECPSSSYTTAGNCYVQPNGGSTLAISGVLPLYDLQTDNPIQFSNAAALSIPTRLSQLNSSGGTSVSAYCAKQGYSASPLTIYGFYASALYTGAKDPSKIAGANTDGHWYTGTVPGPYYWVNPSLAPGLSLNSFALEYQRGGAWYPYSVMRNIAWRQSGRFCFSAIPTAATTGGPWNGDTWGEIHLDPRSDRFGVMSRQGSISNPPTSLINYDPLVSQTLWAGSSYPVPNATTPSTANYIGFSSYMPYLYVSGTSNATGTIDNTKSSAFFLETSSQPGNNTFNSAAVSPNNLVDPVWGTSSAQGYGRYMGTLGDNIGGTYASANSLTSSLNYYADPDGVVRPGVGAYTGSANGTDGRPMAMNGAVTTAPSTMSMVGSSQPIILNRPFRSVAELGYTYRDEPWKDIDFFSNVSADAGLLEAFTIDDTSTLPPVGVSAATFLATSTTPFSSGTGKYPYVAGKINLNTSNTLALQAILYGAIRDDTSNLTANMIDSTDTANVASALVSRTSSTTSGSGPLQSKADLVTKFSADLNPSVYASSSSNAVIKRRREAAIRALADTGNVRTWNLMIDVIVQAGKYTTASTTGNQFVVEGERHYWMHVALDRLTGKIIDSYLESVYD